MVDATSIIKNEKLKLHPSVFEELLNKEKRQYGSLCTFCKIGNVGLKLYGCKSTRDEAFDLQSMVYYADSRLAPQAFQRFEYKEGPIYSYYGYTTEIVQIIEDDEDAWDWYYKRKNVLKPIILQLEKIGFFFDDPHKENWGIKNGRFVPIDFEQGK